MRAAANNKWARPPLGSAGGLPASPATGGSLCERIWMTYLSLVAHVCIYHRDILELLMKWHEQHSVCWPQICPQNIKLAIHACANWQDMSCGSAKGDYNIVANRGARTLQVHRHLSLLGKSEQCAKRTMARLIMHAMTYYDNMSLLHSLNPSRIPRLCHCCTV